jgi:hypothetical protein
MLAERRQKPSGLVGQPETQGERPSSRAGMLSVLALELSELAELPCVFVSTLAVFGERPSVWRRMLHPFRPMPYAFGGGSLSAPTAARRDRSDAIEEAWAALSEKGYALRRPRDALLVVRDALAVRGDAVRRRGRDSRRVTRSSRSSRRARSISEAAAEARGAALTAQRDASRAARDALDGIRDAQQREADAHGEARKPVPTSTESFAVLAVRRFVPRAALAAVGRNPCPPFRAHSLYGRTVFGSVLGFAPSPGTSYLLAACLPPMADRSAPPPSYVSSRGRTTKAQPYGSLDRPAHTPRKATWLGASSAPSARTNG